MSSTDDAPTNPPPYESKHVKMDDSLSLREWDEAEATEVIRELNMDVEFLESSLRHANALVGWLRDDVKRIEAERDRYREALESIKSSQCTDQNLLIEHMKETATQALKDRGHDAT